MTDKELIKQEIERQLYGGLYSIDAKATLENLYTFIDSLPEEPATEEPASEDLEEELDNFLKDPVFGKLINRNAGMVLARHFAKWQENKDKQSLIANDTVLLTEEEFERLKRSMIQSEEDKQQMKDVLQTEYEKGRFDMREEMMKDACEADVVVDRIGEVVYLYPHISEKTGDKAKLIIVKED